MQKWTKPTINDCSGDINKRWYVYYQFRNPETGLLSDFKRSAGVNRIKSVTQRRQAIKQLRNDLEELLKDGFTPFEKYVPKKEKLTPEETPVATAIGKVMELKKGYLKKSSYKPFETRMTHFKDWLTKVSKDQVPAVELRRSDIANFLQHIQEIRGVNNQSRNNYLTELKGLFSKMIEQDYTFFNPASQIAKLPSKPVKNRAFTKDQMKEIRQWLLANDPNLYHFIRWVTYAFLRPVEVCRLQLKNIDVTNQIVYVPTKTMSEKKRRIILRLVDDLKAMDLNQYNPEDYLFTKSGTPGQWKSHLDGKEVDELERRTWFGNRFKQMKKKLGIGNEYGIYSFRHVSVTDLFYGFRRNGFGPYEAKVNMLPITGHATIEALEKYMRDIQSEVAADHSQFIDLNF